MNRKIAYPVFIFLISLFLFSLKNGSIEVFMVDEARNASCAREMMERGDWVVPTFNYELRTDKPPLHYFFMIASYHLFGFNEFAARFFSAVFGALTVLVTFFFARKIFSTRTALWSSLILLSSIHFVLEFHLAVPDPYLIFFITASLFSFLLHHQFGKARYAWAMYIAMALGFLAKGPVAVALPALVILVFLIWTRQFAWKKLKEIKLIRGIMLFLVIAAPWYVMVSIKTDMAWTEGFFLKHNIGRYSDTMEGHGGVYFLTLAYLLLGLLPFSVLLIQSLVYSLRNRRNRNYLFLTLYILIFTLFFSLSDTQLPNYILPVYPACAILPASFLLNISPQEARKYKIKDSLYAGLAISLLIPVAVYLGAGYDANLKGMNYLAWYLIPLPAGFAAAIIFYKPNRFIRSFLFPAGAYILVNIFLYVAIMPQISQKALAKRFTAKVGDHTTIISYKRLNPSFVFYYQEKIPVFHDIDALRNDLARRNNLYLITRKKYAEAIARNFPELTPIIEKKDLFEGHTTVIFKD